MQIGGQSFFDVGNQIPDSMNVPATILDGKVVGLKELLRTEQTIPNDTDTMVVYDVTAEGKRYDDNRIAFRQDITTDEQADAIQRRFGDELGLDVERRSSEFDPTEQETPAGENEVEQMMGDPSDDITPDRRVGSAPQTGPTENVAGITDPIVVELVKDLLFFFNFRSST